MSHESTELSTDPAKHSFTTATILVIATGEQRLFANLLLDIGVVSAEAVSARTGSVRR